MSHDPIPNESRRLAEFCLNSPASKALCREKLEESLRWAFELGVREGANRIGRWARKRPLADSPLVRTMENVARGWHE